MTEIVESAAPPVHVPNPPPRRGMVMDVFMNWVDPEELVPKPVPFIQYVVTDAMREADRVAREARDRVPASSWAIRDQLSAENLSTRRVKVERGRLPLHTRGSGQMEFSVRARSRGFQKKNRPPKLCAVCKTEMSRMTHLDTCKICRDQAKDAAKDPITCVKCGVELARLRPSGCCRKCSPRPGRKSAQQLPEPVPVCDLLEADLVEAELVAEPETIELIAETASPEAETAAPIEPEVVAAADVVYPTECVCGRKLRRNNRKGFCTHCWLGARPRRRRITIEEKLANETLLKLSLEDKWVVLEIAAGGSI